MLLQQEYEDLYVGPEWNLVARYSQILTLSWIVFTYSSGLPSLYLIFATNLFVMYWVDKVLILRYYRLPKNMDERPILFVLNMMKYAFFVHLGIGTIMYSNNRIFFSELSTTPNDEEEAGFRQSRFA